jgi:uncharacterized protein YkwD
MFIKHTLVMLLGIFGMITSNEVVKMQGDTGSNYTESEAKEMVKRHNYHRSKVGVSDLKWSNELASYAQAWANHLAKSGCEMEHRESDQYGENIFWSFGTEYSPSDISDEWASEKKYWKGGTISMRNFSKVGHYTQMIWHNTTEVGCGKAVCANGSVMVVCNYNPPGNYIGQNPLGN